MKYLNHLFWSFLICSASLHAQASIYITGGSVITNQGEITVADGDVEVIDGTLSGGTLIMTGFSGPDNNRLINNDRIQVNWLRLEDGAQVTIEGRIGLSNGFWLGADTQAELLEARILLGSNAFLDGATNNITSPLPNSFIRYSDFHDPDDPGLLGNLGVRMEPSREALLDVDYFRRYGGVQVDNYPTLNRYYEILPEREGAAEVELSLRLPDSELEGNPREDIRLFQSRDEGETWIQIEADDRFENFSEEIVPEGLFAFANFSLLPVELLEFSAQAAGKRKVNNFWQTANEAGSSHFEVERSANGNEFQYLGRVAAAGNSQVNRSYGFQDAAALPGTSYYRLRMVDLDGSFTYSEVAAVHLDESTSLALYPNPARTTVKLDLPEAHVYTHYSLYAADGRLLHKGVPVAGTNTLAVGALPRGVYHLTLEGGGQMITLPLRKQ
ncbi:MAG: T9SS type A sorting domain-containing protein [Lewinella sp.]